MMRVPLFVKEGMMRVPLFVKEGIGEILSIHPSLSGRLIKWYIISMV
jgi:hypothetical protein